MKIKLSIISALLCLFAINSWAQTETTNDYISISELTLQPGGDYGTISLTLNGSRKYTSFGFDLELPKGYAFDPSTAGNWQTAISSKVEKYSMYPYSEDREGNKTYSHTLSANIQEDGSLRIVALSQSSDEFTSNTGVIVKVYIKATPYAKPGYADIKIKNCSFTAYVSGTKKYVTDDIVISDKVSATTDVTLPVTITDDNKWSTCVFPFASAIPAGLKVYSCSEEDAQYAYLTIENEIKAYTPYILYAANGYTNATWTGTAIASDYPTKDNCPAGLLVGAYTTIKTTSGYVLQNKGDGVKLYQIAADKPITIPAGKCYFESQINSSANLALSFEDEADGINEVNANANADAIYDLQGRKVEHPQKNGIYIINGKTVIKK